MPSPRRPGWLTWGGGGNQTCSGTVLSAERVGGGKGESFPHEARDDVLHHVVRLRAATSAAVRRGGHGLLGDRRRRAREPSSRGPHHRGLRGLPHRAHREGGRLPPRESQPERGRSGAERLTSGLCTYCKVGT